MRKRKCVLSVLLMSLFLVAGIKDAFCQENKVNYFASMQSVWKIPDRIDESTLTDSDREELDELEDEDEWCEEGTGEDSWIFVFDFDKDILIWMLQEMGLQAYEEDGLIIGLLYDEDEGQTVELAINLDDLIFEARYFGEEDNEFFEEAGNKLIGVFRVNYKRTNDGFIVPETETGTWYGVLLSGIPCVAEDVTSYLYYEVVNDGGNTIVKTGDENLFNECMGYTDCKEIQPQQTNITIFPNPANEHITISLPLCPDENTDVKIYNMLGINVLSYTHAKSEQMDMDIHSLPAGVYVVRCVTNDKVISTRFVKR